jgi:hypothetical protein
MTANRSLVAYQTALTRAQTIVPYLTPGEVRQLAVAAGQSRNGKRDALLVRVLFEGRPALRIVGKGRVSSRAILYQQ